jgi:hypothetical protein
VVLLDLGDSGHDLPPDHSRTLLTRPFSLPQLSDALARWGPTQPVPDPSGGRVIRVHEVQARGMKPSPGIGPSPLGQAVPGLVRSWRERRLVRISIISITVALLSMGAFALANQSGRCGPGCDELTGADLTSPSSTMVDAVGAGPYATDPGVGVVGPTTTEPFVGSTADEGSESDGVSTGPARISTTTAGSSGAAPTPTSSTDPQRPQPSVPSTLAPTTTRSSAPTTTATTTPTPTTAPTTTTGA